MAATAHPMLTVPRFTIETLERLRASLPEEGGRYELLDGTLLVTPAPRPAHEEVVARVANLLRNALGDAGIARVAMRSEVRRGTTHYFEPDLLVYPSTFPLDGRWEQLTDWWLVVEVLSPSSRAYDSVLKRDAYLALGVRALWLVDPNERRVEVWARGADRAIVLREDDTLYWSFGEGAREARIVIDLADLFRGVPRLRSSEEA